MGLREWFARAEQQQQQYGGIATATPPNGVRITVQDGPRIRPRETDPSLWEYGNVDLRALQAARPFNVNEALARWFEQIGHDSTHRALLHFMTEHPSRTAVYLKMRDLGRHERQRAVTALHADYGLFQTADPDRKAPYSQARIMHKLCRLHGIDLVRMSDAQKPVAAYHGGKTGVPVYAYLETFSTERAPLLAVDIYPYGPDRGPWDDFKHWEANTAQWTFAAACCLAKYLYDEPLYTGRTAPYEIIAPFDPEHHAVMIPLTHVFSKALLHFKWDCPDDWHCACNEIQDRLSEASEAHATATGELPPGVVRTIQGGYGTYSSPSRTMTPPNGTPGDRLREYRRQTDPNLRNPNEQ